MKKKVKYFFLFCLFIFSLFFIKRIQQTLSPKLPSRGSPIVLYSNQCRQDLKSTVLKAIQKTQKSIHLVMFGLSDLNVLNELKNKYDKNVKMQVFYDKRSSLDLKLPTSSFHPIKKTGLMHQKILIIDDKITFLGSTNLTKTSLSMHDNLVVGIYSPEIAAFLNKKTPFNVGRIKKNIAGQQVEIWLLPDTKNVALYRLKNLIREAKKKVKIAMFTLTHPVLIDEIVYAKKRGLEVTVILDYHSSLGASAKALEKLKKEKVKILLSQGPQLLHHKYLYIDEKILVCGSANWTKAAFNKNHDLLLIIHKLKPHQVSFMNKLQDIIEIQTK